MRTDLIERDEAKLLLARAFNEWLERYEADPDEFADSYRDGVTDYGEACADYLLDVLIPAVR